MKVFIAVLVFIFFCVSKVKSCGKFNVSTSSVDFGLTEVVDLPWLVSIFDSEFNGVFLENDLIIAPFMSQQKLGDEIKVDLQTSTKSFNRTAHIKEVNNYYLIKLSSPIENITQYPCLIDKNAKTLEIGQPVLVIEKSGQQTSIHTGKIFENIFTELQTFSDDFGVRLKRTSSDITKSMAMIEKHGKTTIVGAWSATLGPGAVGYDSEFSDHIFKVFS